MTFDETFDKTSELRNYHRYDNKSNNNKLLWEALMGKCHTGGILTP